MATATTTASHSDGIPVRLPIRMAMKPPIKRRSADYYTQFLTQDALNKNPSEIHELVPLEQTPGIISLLAGKPNIDTYPYTDVKFNVKDPYKPDSEITVSLKGSKLAEGLQYGATPGMPDLITWFYELQDRVHNREPPEGWRISIGCGSRELVSNTIRAMVEPGDAILVDENTKNHIDQIPIFRIHPCEIIDVATDASGIIPGQLDALLQGWEDSHTTKRPKVLYTIPFGVGPETPLDRRLEVLKIAQNYDIIILEDDPYYYLTSSRIPSYFALERWGLDYHGVLGEEAGHVIRYDTLSKVLAPGLSIGWMSGPVPLVTAVDMYSSTANLQPGSFTQAVTLALLTTWGHEGFLQHAKNVHKFYAEQLEH